MANTPTPGPSAPASSTSEGTREPASGTTDKLDASEVTDTADTTPRVDAPAATGKRVRAIPYKGGTQVEIRKADFELAGIDHPTVVWDVDKLKGALTLPIGDPKEKNTLSEEAAKYLTEEHSHQFEYIDA